jgi:predicted Zn-dependent protease
MAKSGFDPRQSVNLWQNMDKASGDKRQPEFLSTHPAPASRISELSKNMASAMNVFNKAVERPKCSKT